MSPKYNWTIKGLRGKASVSAEYFEILFYPQENHIPVPNHIIIARENLPEGTDPEGFIETEDFVELNGQPSLMLILCFPA